MKRWIAASAALTCSLSIGCSESQPPGVAAPAEPPPDAPAVTVFTEVAADTGLQFVHYNGAAGDYNLIEIMGAGVGLLDYDLDGDLDVYLVQGAGLGGDPAAALSEPPAQAGNRLFRNELVPDGALAFTDVTAAAGVGDDGYGMGAIVGDVDNDGDPDLYLTNFGANVLYRNEGDGRFTDVTATSGIQDDRWSTSGAFVDYDLDGDLDLFIASYVSFNLRYNKRCTSPAGQRDYCGPRSFEPLTDRLYRNDGDWQFTDVSLESGIAMAKGSGLGVVSADFTGDGWPDIYVANDQLANFLWVNQGDGRFAESALMSGAAYNAAGAAEASMGITAGDIDGDGDEDIFMTHLAGETNTLYINDGSGGFRDGTDRASLGHMSLAFTGFGSEWFDYDNDGLLDLFVANGAVLIETSQVGRSRFPYAQTNQLLHQHWGRFDDVSDRAGAAMALKEVSRGAAFGDLDNDGDIDVVVTNTNGPVRLMRNDVGQRRHWLSVRLAGSEANRDGATARVAVLRPGKAPVWRRAHTDGSYLSANDPRVHFGLGDDPGIEGVGVVWPGGRREVWSGLEVDRTIDLAEGTGASWEIGKTE